MTMRWIMVPLLFVLATTSGCGKPTALEAGTTAIEVGSGIESFAAIAPGSTVDIVCGPQGGQHIWTAVRTETLDPMNANLTVAITAADGTPICAEALDSVLLLPDGPWEDYTGIRCFVADPVAADGKHATLTGTLTDRSGKHASASVSFVVAGPGMSCAH